MSVPDEVEPLVLLVEDHETIRSAFCFLLQESGYRVLAAASGAEALDVAARERPDLILLDLGLPDVSGLEVARRLKSSEATRHAAVVALTGRALDSDRTACFEAGCAGYLIKPIDTQHLLRELPRFLERRQGV